MPLNLVEHDITTMEVDAVVNAANERLLMGGGVCGAIFHAAGVRELQAACDAIGHVDTGSAVATPGFRLAARHVIHTAGPVWQGGGQGERALLAGCYTSSLGLAASLGCQSVAFPLISSGIYGYPRKEAYRVAVDAIGDFLEAHGDMDVFLTLFRGASLLPSSERRSLNAYLDHVLQSEWVGAQAADLFFEELVAPSHERLCPRKGASSLEEVLDHADAPFVDRLLALIDERGITDSQAYKAANMSRQAFAKLKTTGSASKRSILALSVALGLSSAEADDLLRSAGYALSGADRTDLIVGWYLDRGGADIHKVNLALWEHDLIPLGSRIGS